ncbi:NYN domain-containing protein [Lysobacteraceae bacterium NML07-0707]|nr:NYN domain-containing protein [Xanthomonadaceae bacterium NML07-0707]
MSTAIMIDGAYFLKRFKHSFPDYDSRNAEVVAKAVFSMAVEHLKRAKRKPAALYRIYFYDCPPFSKKMHWPVSGKSVDFSRSEQAIFRNHLHQSLRKQRKLALRLGELSLHADWELKPEALEQLRNRKMELHQLEDEHFRLGLKQKAVDMKIGLDIAALAYKKLVDQIVLIAGDSDFVPAAKLARREGIDFILNPMGQRLPPNLFEHIDGLHSVALRPLVEEITTGNSPEISMEP